MDWLEEVRNESEGEGDESYVGREIRAGNRRPIRKERNSGHQGRTDFGGCARAWRCMD